MSYQDLESGYTYRKGDAPNGGQDPSHAVSSGVFQINTALISYNRLTNQLGTEKDTPELRLKLEKSRQHINRLIKETSIKLKAMSEKDHTKTVSTDQKVKDAKLAKDFQTVLQAFEKLQKLSSQRELESSYVQGLESVNGTSPDDLHQSLIYDQKRQELVIQVDNEITFNEAVIDERAQGIRELQGQIEEVHEIFKDLALMVQAQGYQVEEIGGNVDNTFAATTTANRQLDKASRSQKSSNSLSCLLMVIFGVALVIVIIVLAA